MIDKIWSSECRRNVFVAVCDDCGEKLPDADCFEEAVEAMREMGWSKVRCRDGEWDNYCPHCQEVHHVQLR